MLRLLVRRRRMRSAPKRALSLQSLRHTSPMARWSVKRNGASERQTAASRQRVLDMFAGGGAIPLEAARLGCDSHALEYNPVAYLIELCTLVYPQKYGAALATDFKAWSDVLLTRMEAEVDDLYPPVRIPESEEVSNQARLFEKKGMPDAETVQPAAYIWARTVPCQRPGCEAPVPLVRQAWLRKKKGCCGGDPQHRRREQAALANPVRRDPQKMYRRKPVRPVRVRRFA